MAVEQIRAILDHVRDFHEQVSEYYHRLADAAGQTRVRLLLDYMAQHEQRLADSMAEYEASASSQILGTWLQSTGQTDIRDSLHDFEIHPNMSVDEVTEIGLGVHQSLVDLYRNLAESAEPESVRELFASLWQMEEKESQQFSRDVGRLADL